MVVGEDVAARADNYARAKPGCSLGAKETPEQWIVERGLPHFLRGEDAYDRWRRTLDRVVVRIEPSARCRLRLRRDLLQHGDRRSVGQRSALREPLGPKGRDNEQCGDADRHGLRKEKP